jgi:hypothetical protein
VGRSKGAQVTAGKAREVPPGKNGRSTLSHGGTRRQARVWLEGCLRASEQADQQIRRAYLPPLAPQDVVPESDPILIMT